MAKCPYRFPARSRAAMIEALESVGGYGGWNAPGRSRYPFAWNVKIHRFPSSARELPANPFDGVPFNPAWDSAWDSYVESNEWLFSTICEDMARHVLEGDYSTWPGDDSGEFAFSIGGRSGGWLILDSAYGWRMAGLDLDELRDQVTRWGIERSEWSFSDVRRLYRAVMTMESDFASDKIQAEFAYQTAFRRGEWESERRERIAELSAESAGDHARARRLLGELRELRRFPAASGFPAACEALRAAVRHALADSRETRRAALALANGESADDC